MTTSSEMSDGSERAKSSWGRGVEAGRLPSLIALPRQPEKLWAREALNADLACGGQQVVSALCPQSIARGKGAIECAQIGGSLQVG